MGNMSDDMKCYWVKTMNEENEEFEVHKNKVETMGDTEKIVEKKECLECVEAQKAFIIIAREMNANADKLAVLCLKCGCIWKTQPLDEFEAENEVKAGD